MILRIAVVSEADVDEEGRVLARVTDAAASEEVDDAASRIERELDCACSKATERRVRP